MRLTKEREEEIRRSGGFDTPSPQDMIRDLLSEIESLRAEIDTERMRLAACGVAAMQNTDDGVSDRIAKDSPYYSASYGDVCRAVDREMRYRKALEQIRNHTDERSAYLTAEEALNHDIGMTDTYAVDVDVTEGQQ